MADDVTSMSTHWAPQLDPEVLKKVVVATLPAETPSLEVDARSCFVRQQEWLGRVEDVGEESFGAVLFDVTGASPEEEVADISWLLVADQDVDLVVPGALFYWVIGYRITPRERRGESQIIFKRSRPWTAAEQRRAQIEADDLIERFGSPPVS
jgi:hypothetical protein